MESTIVKGISVLELLVRSRGSVRLSVIAEELKLPKSGVHRLLGTLIELGFVRQDVESGRYSATLKLWEWGQNIIADHPAKRAAAPYMQELHRLTQETINLLVLEGDEVLFLDKILAARPLRFSTQPGSRALAVMTAPGKAMLAYEPDAQAIVERSIATRQRAQGLDPKQVMADIEEVRTKGYTSANGSWTVGICSYGAPIMGRNGRAAAAISVTAPTERVDPAKDAQIVEALLYTCARIAETVGEL